MERRPLIALPWLRIVLFLISLLGVFVLLQFLTGVLLNFLKGEQTHSDAIRAVWQGLEKNRYVLSLLAAATASFITVYIFRKRVDKRSIYSLGFAFTPHRASAATGFFLGLLLLGTGTFILIATKVLQWEDLQFNGGYLFTDAVLLLLFAFGEELVFRGYILYNLLQFTNKWVALGISAVLFAVFHINNPGINGLPLLNIFLAGLMLGINYIYTKNLWFSILLHFSWNFYMGCILGYKVSGLPFHSLFQQTLSGGPVLTGGSFGFEGSVVGSMLILLAVFSLGFVYEKKLSRVKPPELGS